MRLQRFDFNLRHQVSACAFGQAERQRRSVSGLNRSALTAALIAVAFTVSACGGGGGKRSDRNYSGGGASFASGPISKACLQAGRKAANRQLCGCIQGVANRDLSGADQKLAVSFFSDPHRAQEIRQSDNARNEAFWKRYKAFAARAEKTCKGY